MESSKAVFLRRRLARELLPTATLPTCVRTSGLGGALDLSRLHLALTRLMLLVCCGRLTHD